MPTFRPMKMVQTERSETLAFKLQTPVNHPEESFQKVMDPLRSADHTFGTTALTPQMAKLHLNRTSNPVPTSNKVHRMLVTKSFS
jgi:hypothetical protein